MLSAHFSTRSTILMVGKKCTISETGLKKRDDLSVKLCLVGGDQP